MFTGARFDPTSSENLSDREPVRAGDGYLLLMLAEAAGWTPTVIGSTVVDGSPARVRVSLRHPVYGECALEGESVASVVPTLVEWAFLRARFGAELRRIAQLAQRCSAEGVGALSRNGDSHA